ncbi:hypothetical protein AEGHOMDF_2980 [Methylobacterium soli]|nr:hypothetical protein AEGHOMDF_2980 [Methylobacterium soli]
MQLVASPECKALVKSVAVWDFVSCGSHLRLVLNAP